MRPEKGGPLRKELRATLKGEPTGRHPRVVRTTYGAGQARRDHLQRMREWWTEWTAGKEVAE